MMDGQSHRDSKSSLKKERDISNSNIHEGMTKKENQKREEMRIELKNSIKKVSYACYLLGFILWIMISSIYLYIKITNALIVFDDIYTNWDNHFILDVVEQQDGTSCDETQNQSNFISFMFPGSHSGCFCDDCSDDDNNEFSIKGMLHGKDLPEEPSTDEDIYFRLLGDNKRNALDQNDDYSDFEEEEFDSIIDYKILRNSCPDADSLDEDDFYQDISLVNPKKISYLLTEDLVEIKLCTRRSESSNFINSYYTRKTQCKADEILCKGDNEEDRSYWFCINIKEKCPIRSLNIVKSSEVDTTVYKYEEEVKLSNGYSLLISRKEDNSMPISEFKLYESDGPCKSSTDFRRWRLSQDNLIYNPLLYGQYSFQCKVDTRYIQSQFQINQKSLFDHANILQEMVAANYPKFLLPQSRIKYNLFYRRYIEFNINCRGFFEDVQNLGNYINRLEKMSISVLVTSSVLSLFNLIDIVYIIIQLLKRTDSEPYPWKNYNFLCFIYSILKYPTAMSLCILDAVLFYRMIICREIGQDVINRKCTDDITSSQFKFMRNHLSFYGIFLHIIVCFCFWSADLHLINFIRKYYLMKKTKMTPFDEFFSLPKADKQYEQIPNGHQDHAQMLHQSQQNNHNCLNLNNNNQNQKINQRGEYESNLEDQNNLPQPIQIQIPTSLNHIEQHNLEKYNENNNYNQNGNMQSVSMQDIGSQIPQLMTDLSKKAPEPIHHLEKKQSKPIKIEKEGIELINLQISETEEDNEDC